MPSSALRHLLTLLALCALLLLCACLPAALAQQAQKAPTLNLPKLPGPDNQRHGSLGGWVQRDRGVGTSVHVQGQADAWVSRSGNSRLGVDGHYDHVVSGPARGAKDYGAFVRFKHQFRK